MLSTASDTHQREVLLHNASHRAKALYNRQKQATQGVEPMKLWTIKSFAPALWCLHLPVLVGLCKTLGS